MPTIHAHVLREAARYAQRARVPVVARDIFSADKWSEQCMQMAQQIEGMSEADALAHLKAFRADLRWDTRSGWSFMTSMDAMGLMDELIDPVAKDKVGWIEMSAWGGLDKGKRSVRPHYRRMLGINNAMSSCIRDLGEPEATWLARRDAWLAQYHPDIKVIRGCASWSEDRCQYTSIVATVSELREMKHVIERGLSEGLQFLQKNGFAHSLRVEQAGPLNRDDGVEYLAKACAEGDEIPLNVGSIVQTKYGLCAIVA